MTTIKFDKAVKYQGLRYAAHEAFKVEDSDVEELKKAGATVLSVEPIIPPQPELTCSGEEGTDDSLDFTVDVKKLKEDLLSYTVADMIEFARANGIDLHKKTKKAEIYNIIVASLK